MEKLKKFRVNFHYNIDIEAKDIDQAEEFAIADLEANGVNLADYAIDTEAICDICNMPEDDDGRCGCVNADAK